MTLTLTPAELAETLVALARAASKDALYDALLALMAACEETVTPISPTVLVRSLRSAQDAAGRFDAADFAADQAAEAWRAAMGADLDAADERAVTARLQEAS